MKINVEIECMRHDVTPGQFLAYVRSQCKKHGGNMEYSAAEFAAASWGAEYRDELPDDGHGAMAETVKDEAFEKQTLIISHDGRVYNQIIEFDFWNNRTGTGYYYEKDAEPESQEEAAQNVKKNVLGIARRALQKAARLEQKAAKAVNDMTEWTGPLSSYSLAWDARTARREAAELRQKAARAIERLPEYIALYAPEYAQEEAQKAQEQPQDPEAVRVFYIPETGETVTESQLSRDMESEGEYPANIPFILSEMISDGVIIQISGEPIEPPQDIPGHDWLTEENIEKLRQALAEARKAYQENPALYHVKISAQNKKMGAVPSVSLLPVLFCPAICRGCHGCGHFCYALKLAMIRGNVLRSWAMNTAIMLLDWSKYWAEIRAALAVSRFFRFHVSGEITGPAYMAELARAAADFPGCEILTFTKRYETVNTWCDDNGHERPAENLRLMFSGLEGVPMNNPYNFPVTRVIMTGTPADQVPADWRICPGHCEDCAARGTGCWQAQPGDTIAFWQH